MTISTTRAELRQRIGRELGDLTSVTATANGSTTRFTDTIRLRTATNTLVDREVIFTSGTNAGTIRRITSDNLTSGGGYFDFAAVTAATATNDTAEIYNFRGRGWSIAEIHDAINAARVQAYPLYKERIVFSLGAFDQDTGYLSITPGTADYIYQVTYPDVNSMTQVVPRAKSTFQNGWSTNDGQVHIRGRDLLRLLNGKTLTAYGYTTPSALSADSDTTSIAPEWIIWTACAMLCRQRYLQTDDSKLYNMALVYDDKAERAKGSIRTRLRPGTRSVG